MKFFSLLVILITACKPTYDTSIPVNTENTMPGTSVSIKGKSFNLYKSELELKEGVNFVVLANQIGFPFKFNNKVTIMNIVPSIDTPTCEAQSHILGESEKIKKNIERVTISRDLPMAQARFAKEAKLTNINYYSDYAHGTFGKKTGLMIEGKELLARAVIVLDQTGVIRHFQLIPEVSQLPDMNKAIEIANDLVK